MTLYAGIDLHSNNSYVCVIDERDTCLLARRFRNEAPLITGALGRAIAADERGTDLAGQWGKQRRDELDQGRIDELLAILALRCAILNNRFDDFRERRAGV